MKIESTPDNKRNIKQNRGLFPITLKGMLWILILLFGLLVNLLLSITTLTIWLLTRNLFYLISSIISGCLFIMWGYMNLKDKEQPTSRI